MIFMDQRFQAFILTAENLSMSKAAELAFVSPQCISGHIRSLEQEYQVSLFIRRPRFELTPEGRHLLEMLYEIKMIENNITTSLNGSHSSIVGRITLGVPSSRYAIIVPRILPVFKQEYPQVELKIASDFSTALTWQVERGKLDMAIVSQQEENSCLKTAACVAERFFCLVPRSLLESVSGDEFPDMAARFRKGITLEEISRFPLILYPPTSRLRRAMDQYSKHTGIIFHTLFETNHMEVFDILSRTLNAASFISEQALPITREANKNATKGNFIYAFPLLLESLEIPFNVSLVHHKSSYLCEYKKFLLECLKNLLAEYNRIDTI